MRRVVVSAIIFVVIIGVAFIHGTRMIKLASDIQSMAEDIYVGYEEKDWNMVREGTGEIKKKWESSHIWAYVTLSTDRIDDIEISLEQSMAYAQEEADENFIGEFTMFCMLIDHLPKQEAFSFGELF